MVIAVPFLLNYKEGAVTQETQDQLTNWLNNRHGRLYSRTPLGLPLNTDTSRYYGQFALSLGKGLESPYIFSKFDPLNVNTRTFYMFLWPHQFPC